MFYNLYQHEETGRTQISNLPPGERWTCVGTDVVSSLDGSYLIFDAHDTERIAGEARMLLKQLTEAGVPHYENGAKLSLWDRVLRMNHPSDQRAGGSQP
jgi:hypothetical protein